MSNPKRGKPFKHVPLEPVYCPIPGCEHRLVPCLVASRPERIERDDVGLRLLDGAPLAYYRYRCEAHGAPYVYWCRLRVALGEDETEECGGEE